MPHPRQVLVVWATGGDLRDRTNNLAMRQALPVYVIQWPAPDEVSAVGGRTSTGAQVCSAFDPPGQTTNKEKDIPMVKTINLLDHWKVDQTLQTDTPLELIRPNGREVPVIPFTSSTLLVSNHYCDEPEIRGYIRCNGNGCVLCRIGRPVEERALLPVYLPAQAKIGILPISPSSRPGALRPQLMPFLRSDKKVVLFIRKVDQLSFHVGSKEVPPGMYHCEKLVADFQQRLEAGEIDLAAVYRSLDNASLAKVDGIATLMQLKGVRLGGDN